MAAMTPAQMNRLSAIACFAPSLREIKLNSKAPANAKELHHQDRHVSACPSVSSTRRFRTGRRA